MPAAARGDPAEGRVDEALHVTVLPQAGGDAAVAAADLAAGSGADVLAVEEHHLSVARYRALGSVADGLRLADLGTAIEQERIVKDDEEITCLRIAAEIADQALGELLESILVGRTERHLALELERRLVDHGADGPAFPTSVATGPNSGRGGHRPSDRRVEEGDFSPCAWAPTTGATAARSAARSSSAPLPPTGRSSCTTSFAAQRAAREALAPGTACRDVDRAARQILDGAGYGRPGALPRARGGAGNRGGPAALPVRHE